jgi:hypothetical protein
LHVEKTDFKIGPEYLYLKPQLFSQSYLGDEIEEGKLGGACGKRRRRESRRVLVGKREKKKEAASKTCAYMEDNEWILKK